MIKIYNSLSGKKEKLTKTKKLLKLFVCGPTVYDYIHLGNARTYLAFDIIARYLRSEGYNIFYLQNITDIDDKIIKRAAKEKKSPKEVAAFFTKRFFADVKALGIQSVTTYAQATKFIREIIRQVQTLIKKEYAYEIPGDGYYFDISKFKEYGKLAKRTASQAEDGVSRIDESIGKKNRGDFCLWKFRKEGDPFWKTPLGEGRPGWHIEDTAISESFFGPQYDMHGGAIDLKFPHHEAEIAQQEAASGKTPFVKIWMHAGLLLVDGKKMSKSLGNFITVDDFLKKHSPEVFRWIVLNHHYRSPANYTEQLAVQAKESLKTIKEFLEKLEFVSRFSKQKVALGDGNRRAGGLWENAEKEFRKAMHDDFNTPAALACLFGLIGGSQKNIWQMPPKDAQRIRKFMSGSFKILGLAFKTEKTPLKVKKLAGERELLRVHKQFTQADALRKKINGLGFEVEDTPLGPFVKKTS